MATLPTGTRGDPAVLQLIGNTPLVEITRLDTGPCRLFVKLETQNPGGSIKDRIALSMIDAAEADGQLKPGGTVVEATAGNTGLGLALVARAKGYRLLLVIPDKMSAEKVLHLKALGADVRMTRSDVGQGPSGVLPGHGRSDSPPRFPARSTSISSPTRPIRWRTSARTGPEIWEQMEHDVDAVVCGVGSGGTLTGLTPFLRARQPGNRDGAGRSGRARCSPATSATGKIGDGRLVGGRRHRRGFRARRSPICPRSGRRTR